MSELPPASGSYAQHDAGQTIRLTGWTLKPTDPYTELRVLGKGATGVVLVARHEPSGQLVAIKRLAPSLAADPRFISEFRREFEVLRGLRHPNIAAVHWFTDQGAPVICMQLVDGVGLDMLLERGGALGAEAALALLSGSLQGLEHAHRAGIVHRDYKPANVVVDQRGTSSLVDFGVAVRSGQVTDPVGTPRYMAPEQWTSGAVGPQTDVYATTAVFFEVLTGHRPYAGATLTDLRNQHLGSPIPYQEAPPPLQNLIWRGLAKSPEQRYPTAGAFLEELRQAAASGYGPDWERRGAAVLV